MKPYVGSEVGRLKQVLLHRPGKAMLRLTPSNKDDLLFDDVLWLERAQHEHDVFAETLRSRGVEVLYLADLLAEALADREARERVLDVVVTEEACGAGIEEAVRNYAESLPEAELAELIEELSAQMMTAAQHLQFEAAARLRDEIEDLKKELRAMKRAH